jgi:hypothetical protein
MANRPIIQNSTLTDENGTEALSVATGGAVTLGTEGNTTLNKPAISLGGATPGVSNNVVSSRRVSLTDDASYTLFASSSQCLLFVSNTSTAISYAFVIRGGLNSVAIFVDYASAAAVSDTDNKLCVYHNGTSYVIKNRTGSTAVFNVTAINSEQQLL